jgi:hypothetical protein
MNPTQSLKNLLAAVDNYRITAANYAAVELMESSERGDDPPDYSRLTPSEGRLLSDILADLVLNWWEGWEPNSYGT